MRGLKSVSFNKNKNNCPKELVFLLVEWSLLNCLKSAIYSRVGYTLGWYSWKVLMYFHVWPKTESKIVHTLNMAQLTSMYRYRWWMFTPMNTVYRQQKRNTQITLHIFLIPVLKILLKHVCSKVMIYRSVL